MPAVVAAPAPAAVLVLVEAPVVPHAPAAGLGAVRGVAIAVCRRWSRRGSLAPWNGS